MSPETSDDPMTVLPHGAASTTVAELVAQVAELERCQRQEDVDGFLELFDDSALWVTGGGVRLVGKAEIAGFTRKVLPGAFAHGSVTYVVRLISVVSPDIVITSVDQTYLDDDGEPLVESARGRPTYTWRRSRDSVWRIVCGQNTGVAAG